MPRKSRMPAGPGRALRSLELVDARSARTRASHRAGSRFKLRSQSSSAGARARGAQRGLSYESADGSNHLPPLKRGGRKVTTRVRSDVHVGAAPPAALDYAIRTDLDQYGGTLRR